MSEQYLFQKIQASVNEKLRGLPGFCRLVIFQSLQYYDIDTGKILLPSLEEFANKEFRVDTAPGRKKENINGDTLRNAIRTIKKSAHKDFKFSVQNQRVMIELPFLLELYQKSPIESKEVADPKEEGSTETNTLNQPGVSAKAVSKDAQEVTQEVAEASQPIKDINNINIINIKNKNNNYKNSIIDKFCIFQPPQKSSAFNNSLEKPKAESYSPCKPPIEPQQGLRTFIADDYFPSAITLEKARARGIVCASEPSKIQKFVDYNKAIGSKWVDFDSVYLLWLSIPKNQESNISLSPTTKIRSIKHAYLSNAGKARKSTQPFSIDASIAKNTRIMEDEWGSQGNGLFFN